MANQKDTSTDLVPISDELVAEAIMGGEVKAFVDDPMIVSKQIASRILQADSIEEILDQGEALHARDNLGRPFVVRDVSFANSQFTGEKAERPDGPKVFAVLQVEFLDGGAHSGKVVPMTCGGMNVMAQLLRAKMLGVLSTVPFALKEIEGTTAGGFKPLWLIAAQGVTVPEDKRAAAATA